MAHVTKLIVDPTENIVKNVIVFDHDNIWTPPDGMLVLDVPPSGNVGIHWIYDPVSQTFSRPPEWDQYPLPEGEPDPQP